MAEPAADQRDAGIVTEPRRVAGQGGARGRFRLLLAVAVPPAVLVAVVGAALLGSPARSARRGRSVGNVDPGVRQTSR